jgi:hypothetical protein
MFSQASPLNARDTVQDVILLFTDGEPRSPKGSAVEKAMVVTETNKLKQKNVTIVGVAAGSPKVIKTFKKDIQSWVTDSSEVAETSLETLDKDVDKLVNKIFNPLCKPRPGKCCRGRNFVGQIYQIFNNLLGKIDSNHVDYKNKKPSSLSLSKL